MRSVRYLIIAVVLIFLTAKAHAMERAVVVFYKSGCDYFIADGPRGLYLLEWYGGYDPSEGDIIVGGISSYGFKKVYYPQ